MTGRHRFDDPDGKGLTPGSVTLATTFFKTKKIRVDFLQIEEYNSSIEIVPGKRPGRTNIETVKEEHSMIKAALFIFLVLPLIFFSVVLLVLLCTHSSLFLSPEPPARSDSRRMEFPQPGLSRFELDRIVGQVRRFDRQRTHFSSRPVYYFL